MNALKGKNLGWGRRLKKVCSVSRRYRAGDQEDAAMPRTPSKPFGELNRSHYLLSQATTRRTAEGPWRQEKIGTLRTGVHVEGLQSGGQPMLAGLEFKCKGAISASAFQGRS
jgi:hypothetical protein